MEKLAGSCVAVFGVGGVGSHCIEALARGGVGRLVLIDNDTVKECIWCAREQDSGFVDQNGVNLACLKRRVMTYWVEYTETPEGYRIQSAYCHRMRFEEVQA